MASTAVARAAHAITDRARQEYDPAQMQLIKHSIMPPNTNDAELAMFLEICARYELDPFSGQIWAVRYQSKVCNIVARDGWLALANRSDDYRGCQSFEIREHDLFIPTIDEHGHVRVQHDWRDLDGNPSHGGTDGELRGPIVAGFAYVRRAGHVDTQFMAHRAQYDKKVNAWSSHPSAMMVKVAEANALRKAFPISGLYAEGELQPDPLALTRPGERPIEIDFGEDEDLARDLKVAFETLGWRHAKIRTVMRGCESREDRITLLEELRTEVEHGPIVDAEPVPEP